MQIAVTGGRGRLGRYVVAKASRRGHGVVSIDLQPGSPAGAQTEAGGHGDNGCPQGESRDAVAEVVADVTSYDDLKRAVEGCDALVHLAARPGPRGWPAHEVHNLNVVANYNALCVAVELGIDNVCLASSINAIGAAFSRQPRYDYFPLDEEHPTYNEEAYSLSKWVGEVQATSVCRRYENLTVGSLRMHYLATDSAAAEERVSLNRTGLSRELWGYTTFDAAARACLDVLGAHWSGHEVFYVVAPRTGLDEPTADLCAEFYPEVPLRREFSGNEGFFSGEKAAELLGWQHDTAEDDNR